MKDLLLLCFIGSILNGCLNLEKRQEQPMVIEELMGNDALMDGNEPTTEITWINIPAGSFMMGSDIEDSEQPIHPVTVQAFQMSKTEVTVEQYRQCVEEGRCSEPVDLDGLDDSGECNWTSYPSGKEKYPINCVDWGQARTFALWTGGDLLTEAQWEYAARGGEYYEYAGSNNADEVAWYAVNSGGSTHPVQTKRANGYGLYDMSGNVWEWTLDEWHDDYVGAPSQAEISWGTIPECSQLCDMSMSRRISRGGGWSSRSGGLRVETRGGPEDRFSYLGFRVGRTLP